MRLAVNDITLGLEAMVCTITPFDILAGFLLLGERFTWLMAAGCGASLAGVVLVAQVSRARARLPLHT